MLDNSPDLIFRAKSAVLIVSFVANCCNICFISHKQQFFTRRLCARLYLLIGQTFVYLSGLFAFCELCCHWNSIEEGVVKDKVITLPDSKNDGFPPCHPKNLQGLFMPLPTHWKNMGENILCFKMVVSIFTLIWTI